MVLGRESREDLVSGDVKYLRENTWRKLLPPQPEQNIIIVLVQIINEKINRDRINNDISVWDLQLKEESWNSVNATKLKE